MAQTTVNLASHAAIPPNTGDSAEFGDSYRAAMAKINTMMTELYNGGLASGGFGVQPAPTAKTTSATLTAAEILAVIITDQGGGGAVALTLPLASDWETGFAAAKGAALANNDSFTFSVINISTAGADVITMTTNTGWTLVGDMTLAANIAGDESSGTFRARRTAANTYTLYRI